MAAEAPDLLVLFGDGHDMAVPELLWAFREQCPKVARISYESVHPASIQERLKSSDPPPDVCLIPPDAPVDAMGEDGLLHSASIRAFATDRLSLIVAAGDPRNIFGLADLERDNVRLCTPSPQSGPLYEYTCGMYRDFGGEDFEDLVVRRKWERGEALLCKDPHREGAKAVEEGRADVAPGLYSVGLNLRNGGHRLSVLEIGEMVDQHESLAHVMAPASHAEHSELAASFMEFMAGARAQRLLSQHGFLPLMI